MKYTLTDDMLWEVVELADADLDDVRDDYSGRGMYGKQCLGYTGDRPEAFALALGIVLAGMANRDDLDAHDVMRVAEDGPASRSDSMGLGRIVYWPTVTCTKEDAPL